MTSPYRTGLYRAAVLLALVALLGGGTYAYRGYADTSGPGGAVRGYFAALARGDAAAALGFGTIPRGDRDYLTSDVLREQLRIAPIREVRVGTVTRHGASATVAYAYRLDFTTDPQVVHGTVQVSDRTGSWQLARAALSTFVQLEEAGDRATLAGTIVPDIPVLLFPGALPISFDTSTLQLAYGSRSVGFASTASTELTAEVSRSGQRVLQQVLQQKLQACFAPRSSDLSCPLPGDGRVVPGSLRGSIEPGPHDATRFTMGASANGEAVLDGAVGFVGTYQRLDFDNIAEPGRGRLELHLSGTAMLTGTPTISFRTPE